MESDTTFLARRWGARERKTGLLIAALAGIFASYLGIYLLVTLHRGERYPFGDFFALWSYAKIALSQSAATLYDPRALHAAQAALGMPPGQENPFPYPPSFVLYLWPLGALAYIPAYLAWIGASLALYVWAMAARPGRAISIALALLAPTTAIMLVAGQSGFLAAALALGGLRLVDTRPVLAGVLFGLLTYKPQLGLLVPIALIAAGSWRAIAAACLTAAALIIVTAAAFGWPIWASWLHQLPIYSRQFDAGAVGYNLMPTLTANLQMLGASLTLARPAQAVAAIGVAVIVWRAFRGGVTPRATNLLLAGTFLATPHAFVYDLPMLTGAISGFIAERLRGDAAFNLGEIAILLVGLAFPALMMWAGPHIPLSSFAELLVFGLLLTDRRAAREAPRA
jgi:alpha-1,2-mannosyltransferase